MLRFCQLCLVILHRNIQEKGNKHLKNNSICHVLHKHTEEGKNIIIKKKPQHFQKYILTPSLARIQNKTIKPSFLHIQETP